MFLSYLWGKKKIMLEVSRLMGRTANGHVAKCGKKPIFVPFLTEQVGQ